MHVGNIKCCCGQRFQIPDSTVNISLIFSLFHLLNFSGGWGKEEGNLN